LMVLLSAIKYRSSEFKLGENGLVLWDCSQIKVVEEVNSFSTVSWFPANGVESGGKIV
jgi:hypothetical protein